MEVSVAAPTASSVVSSGRARRHPGAPPHVPAVRGMCGLEIHVEDDQVTLIRADQDDVWRKGYLCPKGTTLGQLHHDPDRLRAPDGPRRRRRGARSRWDEAFARCEELLHGVLDAHGIDAVHRLHRQPDRPQLLARPLRRRCSSAWRGFPTIYSAGTVDQWPKNVVVRPHVRRTCGRSPSPDVHRTDYWS